MLALAAAPSYPIAFLAGLVSFLSPCVFPLIPAYAAYLSGHAGRPALATAGGSAIAERDTRVPVITNGVAFVLGFSAVFIAVFYVFQVLEITVFSRNLDLVNRIAGAVIIAVAWMTATSTAIPRLVLIRLPAAWWPVSRSASRQSPR